MLEELKKIVKRFPSEVVWAFAYGSAIRNLHQSKMVDLLFVVKDPLMWHENNMKLNNSHYSYFLNWSNKFHHFLQDYGAGIYYKTHIPVENKIIKYGVVGEQKLILDLKKWQYLYLAGRLHKPIFTIYGMNDIILKNCYNANLVSAIKCSQLFLPQHFNDDQLFKTISQLSYQGDFRMYFAEDKDKVEHIVTKQKEHFKELYDSPLNEVSRFLHFNSTKSNFEQDTSPEACFTHLNNLPSNLAYLLHKEFIEKTLKMCDQEEAFSIMSTWPDLPIYLSKCISKIVWRSSIQQAVKGFFTTGLINSIQYSVRKLNKGILSNLGYKQA